MSSGAERPGGGRGDRAGEGPGDDPRARQPAAWRLVGTLGTAAALAGLAIVLVHQWAQPQIEAHRVRERRAAIREVLGGPERFQTLYVAEGRLRPAIPAGSDSASVERVYAGYGPDGQFMGFAVPGEKSGYQDVIRLIFGYDPRSDEVLGMKVLESKETPGLGAKITSDSSFISEFEGVEPPLRGVKDGGGDEPHQVDMITGATISSEAVIDIINGRLRELGPALEEYRSIEAVAGDRQASAGGAPSAESRAKGGGR